MIGKNRIDPLRCVIITCIMISSCFLSSSCVKAAPNDSSGTNLTNNPSFETFGSKAADGTLMPDGWTVKAYDGNPESTLFTLDTKAHTGSYSAVIENKSKNDARFVQVLKVEENSKYRVSCWIMTENISQEGKGANISIWGRLETSKPISGSNGKWEHAEIYALIGQGVDNMEITAGVGGYMGESTGKALFDDVAVEKTDEIPEGAVIVRIEKPEEQDSGSSANDSDTGNDRKSSSLLVYLILAAATLSAAALYQLKKAGLIKE